MTAQRALFLIGSLRFGGAEKQTIGLLNELSASHIEIHLGYFVDETYLLPQICPKVAGKTFCLHKHHKLDFGSLRRLKAKIEEIRPTIVVSENLYPSVYVHLIRVVSRWKFRTVQVIHSTATTSIKHELAVRGLYRYLINRSDSVVFVSSGQMSYWRRRYGVDTRRATVIRNGVDTEEFRCRLSDDERRRRRAELGFSNEDIVIGIVSALRPEKRHVDFLEAFQVLVKRGYPVKAVLVGDGPERPRIESAIAEAGLARHVVTTGFQADVRPFLEISELCVLSSVTETCPMAILEAMSMGKAVIAPNIGGVPELIVDQRNGRTYAVGNIKQLADCIESILDKKVLTYMGACGRETACDKFGIARMVADYQNALSTFVSSGNAATNFREN